MTNKAIIGLNVFGHDSASALVRKDTGEVLFASAEERFTNRKHDPHFPKMGIDECLRQAEKHGVEVTDVAVNVNPTLFISGTLTRELTALSDVAKSQDMVEYLTDIYAIGEYFESNSSIHDRVIAKVEATFEKKQRKQAIRLIAFYFNWAIKYRKAVDMVRSALPQCKIHTVDHHMAHAACAYYGQAEKDCAILVIDGQGESDTVSIYKGSENGIENIALSYWPHSIGAFYLSATKYLGYDLGDEFRVMGMAAYGKPIYYDDLITAFSINDNDELIISANDYIQFRSLKGLAHTVVDFDKQKLQKTVKARKKDGEILQEHFDFAASVQKVTETLGVQLAERAMKKVGVKNIAIAGGVGLNGLMNEQIRLQTKCDNIFVYPAAGDDGGAVGSAQFIARFGQATDENIAIESCYYGIDGQEDEIVAALESLNLKYEKKDNINATIAQALADKNIVARYRAEAEFGPRALGNRSILGNPMYAEMKDILNERIKHREPFRPFAPVCLLDRVGDYFEIDVPTPFMLLICQAKEKARQEAPAIVHNDNTARVQTITPKQNQDFYNTITEFEKLTGLPIVINTSFNVNGEVIVNTPLDALESFGHMDIDFIAIGDFWVSKAENKERFPSLSDKDYLELRKNRFKAANKSQLAYENLLEINRHFAYFAKDVSLLKMKEVLRHI